jgi:hypothetical protein
VGKFLNRSVFRKVSLVVALVGALVALYVACVVATPDYPSSTPVIHKKIGKHDLNIPQPYARDLGFGGSGGSINDGFLETYYPGGAPLPAGGPGPYGKPTSKRIRIQFHDLDQIPEPYRDTGPEKFLEGRLQNSQAYHVVGEQYGLTYQEQPDNPRKAHVTHNEFWIERKDGKLVSFIECNGEGDVRHCNHYFRDSNFSYQVVFDKTYLPEWSTLRANVIALMDSFMSDESARAFLIDQISKSKTGKGSE